MRKGGGCRRVCRLGWRVPLSGCRIGVRHDARGLRRGCRRAVFAVIVAQAAIQVTENRSQKTEGLVACGEKGRK